MIKQVNSLQVQGKQGALEETDKHLRSFISVKIQGLISAPRASMSDETPVPSRSAESKSCGINKAMVCLTRVTGRVYVRKGGYSGQLRIVQLSRTS